MILGWRKVLGHAYCAPAEDDGDDATPAGANSVSPSWDDEPVDDDETDDEEEPPESPDDKGGKGDDDEEEPPEPPAKREQGEQDEEEYIDLREVLKQHGYPVDQIEDMDDQQVLEHLLGEREQYVNGFTQAQQRLRQMEEYNRQLQAYEQQLAQAHQQGATPPEMQQEAYQQSPFNLPEFDPRWLDMVEQDENGNVVARPGADPQLPQRIREFYEAREQAVNHLLSDPVSAMWPVIAPQVGQLVGGAIQQQLGGYQEQQSAKDFLRDRPDLFEKNQDGTPNYRQANEDGRRFHHFVKEAVGLGIQTQQGQIAYANRLLEQDRQLRGAQSGGEGQESGGKREKSRRRRLKRSARAGRQRNRKGGRRRKAAEAPQNDNIDMEQALSQAFQEAGYDMNDNVGA